MSCNLTDAFISWLRVTEAGFFMQLEILKGGLCKLDTEQVREFKKWK